jgi:SAM-dependent methyltransferase
MFVGSTGIEALSHAGVFWDRTKNAMSNLGSPMRRDTRVLDIGVGWGRLYRWALRDISTTHLTGIDIDPKTIEMCKAAMPYGDFRHVPPGAQYPAGYDLAFAYSVFSHVSEAVAKAILAEARLALNPGGILALTTLQPAHIDVWSNNLHKPVFTKALAIAKFNKDEWWKRAAVGAHLYVPTGGGDDTRPEDQYGEAVISAGWWAGLDGYRLVRYEVPSDMPQAFVVLQRA